MRQGVEGQTPVDTRSIITKLVSYSRVAELMDGQCHYQDDNAGD